MSKKIYSSLQQCKNYKNRSRFSKVMITNVLPPFLLFTVYICKFMYLLYFTSMCLLHIGLRIVRCCDRCDIIGSIKGTKEIRGAHWHCYRCRNGFNRRDEAVKHYRTHFRSPQTTYQIQIVSVSSTDILAF